MGDFTYVFERVERKFLLTPTQYAGLMRVLPEYMQADQYGESTILSLYLDTEDSLLIRRSLEKRSTRKSCACAATACRAVRTTSFWK